jgi:predicted secreted protein
MRGAVFARTALALAALSSFVETSAAHEVDRPMNQVSFQVSSTRDVANDWAVATVGVTEEDSDSARLADRVNETMRWALDVAKRAKGVEVRSGGYQTHPMYDDGKIVRWNASQDLRLESADVEALSELLGELQSRLLLRGVSFEVAPETQRKIEKELVSEALAAFRVRAKHVQGDLGARDHAIVALNIDTPRGGHPAPMMMEMQAAKRVAPPAFEGGESTLAVNVHVTIELEF